jgi:hypothetical protein
VIVMDDIGKDCPLASLAKTTIGRGKKLPRFHIQVSVSVFVKMK